MTLGAFMTLLVAVAFGGLLFWAYRPSNKDRLQSLASIPLDDDDAPESRRNRRGRN